VLARQVFGEPIPINEEVIDLAFMLMRQIERLKARDAVHAAVVIAHRLQAICSYDRDFDGIPGVRRIEPDAVFDA
jgi:predicted nucleic acid-binding protein